MAETALRVLRIPTPDYYFFQPDDRTGFSHYPGAHGWHGGEGKSYVRINATGFHDKDWFLKKPEGAYRIAILGDSFVEALQLPPEQNFLSVMVRRLGHSPAMRGKRVEVLNFGVSGYGTAQEYILLKDRVLAYAPDLIVLALFTDNDIANNSKALFPAPPRPYFIWKKDALIADFSFRQDPEFQAHSRAAKGIWRSIKQRSLLLQWLSDRKNAMKRWVLNVVRSKAQSDNTSVDLKAVYSTPQNTVWHEAWLVTERLLISMRNDAVKGGAEFLLVTLSNPAQVHPQFLYRREFLKGYRGGDMFYPERRLQALGRRQNMHVLCLAPEFLAYAEKHQAYLHGFANSTTGIGTGHWNALGHRLAGHRIAREIQKQFLNARS